MCSINSLLQRVLSTLIGLLMCSSLGCSSTGQSFTLFPAGHFLMDTTVALRDAAPPQTELPRELTKTVLASYIIQPSDVLLVETEALDSPVRFPADQAVLPDGTIDLGSYGRRQVAGKTIEDIEAEITQLIRAGGDRTSVINVRLITPRSAVYYVLGEVNAPGAFPLSGRETVLDGVLAAGGISGRSSDCNVVLSRPTSPNGCRIVLPICYRHITQIGDTTTNFQLMPGDRIYVASRTLCEQLAFWNTTKSCCNCQSCQHNCPEGTGGPSPTTFTLPFVGPESTIHNPVPSELRSSAKVKKPGNRPNLISLDSALGEAKPESQPTRIADPKVIKRKAANEPPAIEDEIENLSVRTGAEPKVGARRGSTELRFKEVSTTSID